MEGMSKRFPELAAKTVAAASRQNCAYSLQATPSGAPSLMYRANDGQQYLLYDNEKPLEKTQQWLTGLNLPSMSGKQVVLVGFGLGYQALVLLSMTSDETPVLCIEKDVELLALACRCVDLEPLWNSPRFQLLALDSPRDERRRIIPLINEAKTIATGISGIVFPGFRAIHPHYPEQLSTELEIMTVCLQSDRATRGCETASQGTHPMKNLEVVFETPAVLHLFGQFKDMPAVVVSAGPSLRKNMHLLKQYRDQVIVVAVDTAWRILHREGIHADLVVARDFTELNYRHFEGPTPSPDTWLVFEPQVDPRIPAIFPKQGFVFTSGTKTSIELCTNSIMKWVVEHTGEKGELAGLGTTSITALDLAAKMGCCPIAIIGQDLAYSGGEVYAKGAMQQEAGLDNSRHDNLRTVKGQQGEELKTSDLLYVFKANLESFIRWRKLELVNATEGGAQIEGSQNQPLTNYLQAHAVAPLGITDKLRALHVTPPPVDQKHLGGDLLAMGEELEKMEQQAHQGIREIEEKSNFMKVVKEETERLFAYTEPMAICVPLLGEELNNFNDADVEVRNADNPERGLSLNRRRHLRLFKRIEEAGGEMARLFRGASDRMVAS
jgi:hypothetical protein